MADDESEGEEAAGACNAHGLDGADFRDVATQIEVAEFLLEEYDVASEARVEVEIACRLMVSLSGGHGGCGDEDMDLAGYGLARLLRRWVDAPPLARSRLEAEFDGERDALARANRSLLLEQFPHAAPTDLVDRAVACGITSLLRGADRALDAASDDAAADRAATLVFAARRLHAGATNCPAVRDDYYDDGAIPLGRGAVGARRRAPASSPAPACAACGAPAALACAACRGPRYCGAAHQRRAWASHRVSCGALAALRRDGGPDASAAARAPERARFFFENADFAIRAVATDEDRAWAGLVDGGGAAGDRAKRFLGRRFDALKADLRFRNAVRLVACAVEFGIVDTRTGVAGARNVAGTVVVPARRGAVRGRRRPVNPLFLVGKAPALLGAPRVAAVSPPRETLNDVEYSMSDLGLAVERGVDIADIAGSPTKIQA